MGTYLNPGNVSFAKMRKGKYKDKSGLIALINETIGTNKCLTCVSRPRRFGKTYAAQMLCAYYDNTCDSHNLFDDLEISKAADYEEHLNKYEVIYLDIAGFLSKMDSDGIPIRDVTSRIKAAIRAELVEKYPVLAGIPDATDCMLKVIELSADKEEERNQFVFVIDEWDAVIRMAKNDEKTQTAYLNLLREWFKNGNFTSKAVAAAYMTGILPIKKDDTQTAISDFDEYPILKHPKLVAMLMRSKQLFEDTLGGNAEAVAAGIQDIREKNYTPQQYNNEQALRSAIKFAYIVCVDNYLKIEELASGKGLADIVYLPTYDSAYPAILIELKYEKTSDSAIGQIKQNNYPAILADYYGEIILVGVNYNSKTKEHTCVIEKYEKK